jgi:hypothetical protein
MTNELTNAIRMAEQKAHEIMGQPEIEKRIVIALLESTATLACGEVGGYKYELGQGIDREVERRRVALMK